MLPGLVTIVVPVYNVKEYLNRCLKSIVLQTYKNIEIILVDDGSTDGSGKMCDQWKERDKRIKVIHKKNAGLGYARNSGLDISNGQYIVFVDSDDYIMPELCELSVKRMQKFNADLCYFGCIEDYEFYDKRPKKYNNLKNVKDVYENDEVINDFLTNTISQSEYESGTPKISMSAWSVMYSRKVIEENHIRFVSERDYLSEDLFFRIELCKFVKRVVTISECLYCYCHNRSSLTTNYRNDRFEAATNLYVKLVHDTREFGINSEIEKRCKRLYLNNVIACLKQTVVHRSELGSHNVKLDIIKICKNSTVKNTIKSYPMNNLPLPLKLLFLLILHQCYFLVFMLTYIRLKKTK